MGFLPGFYSSCASVCATFIFTFSMTSATFQNMMHAIIAFNRFTAFFWPQQHVRFWRRRNLTAILLVVCGFSLAVSVPNAFFPSEYILDDHKAIRGLGSDGYVAKVSVTGFLAGEVHIIRICPLPLEKCTFTSAVQALSVMFSLNLVIMQYFSRCICRTEVDSTKMEVVVETGPDS